METRRGIILVSIECLGTEERTRTVTGWRVVVSDQNQVVRCWLHSSQFKRMLHFNMDNEFLAWRHGNSKAIADKVTGLYHATRGEIARDVEIYRE